MNAEITEEQRAHAEAIGESKWGTLQPIPKPEPVAPIVDTRTWHIAHCVGKSDQHALDWLKEQEFETYYPMMREMRLVPRKTLSKRQRASGIEIKKPLLVPLLPRYIFVRFDMGKEGWRRIFSFAGIGGMVCEGDLPARVPDIMVDNMKGREIDGAVPGKTPAKFIFAMGERVFLKEGAFANFPAEVEALPDVPIEEIDVDTRIRVAVSIFGRPTPVETTVGQVGKY